MDERAKLVFDEILDEKSFCLGCGKCVDEVDRIETDHIAPKSRGGDDDRSNYQPLCRSCNKKKSASYIDFRPAFILGYNLGIEDEHLRIARVIHDPDSNTRPTRNRYLRLLRRMNKAGFKDKTMKYIQEYFKRAQ